MRNDNPTKPQASLVGDKNHDIIVNGYFSSSSCGQFEKLDGKL